MHQITELDQKGLREFGLIGGLIIAVLFGVVLPLLRHQSLSVWPWFIAGILCIWAIAAPATLNIVYQIWMKIGLVLGRIQTRILLGIVFYAIIFPMTLTRRLFNQDPMARRFEPNLPTYRNTSQFRTRESMEQPF